MPPETAEVPLGLDEGVIENQLPYRLLHVAGEMLEVAEDEERPIPERVAALNAFVNVFTLAECNPFLQCIISNLEFCYLTPEQVSTPLQPFVSPRRS